MSSNSPLIIDPSDAERKASRVQTIKDVLDCHGQIQARLTCRMNGIWSVCSTDNSDTFTVNFDDPLFRDVIKRPWDHPEWSTPSRINILLELLYWVRIFQPVET